MSGNATKNWLADYASPRERTEQLQTLERDEGKEYRAYGVHSPDSFPMLDVRDKHGNGYLLNYAFLRQVKYSVQSSPQVITLVFSDCLVTLEGSHFRELLHKLQEHKVEYVQEFNPQKWQKPDEKETVIDAMVVTTFEKV